MHLEEQHDRPDDGNRNWGELIAMHMDSHPERATDKAVSDAQ